MRVRQARQTRTRRTKLLVTRTGCQPSERSPVRCLRRRRRWSRQCTGSRGEPVATVPTMTDPEMDRLRRIAREAASRGGEVVSAAGRGRRSGVTAKSLPGDWVTEVDVASERAIVAFLGGETPDIPVQGEEEGGVSSGLRWVDRSARWDDELHPRLRRRRGVGRAGGSSGGQGRRHPGAVPRRGVARRGGRRRGVGARRRVGDRLPGLGAPWSEAVVGTGFPFRRKERLGRVPPGDDVHPRRRGGSPPAGGGVPGPRVGRVRRVRRVLRARTVGVGRRGWGSADPRGGRRS